MKPHHLHREAQEEYAAAAEHYASISPALGIRFYEEIERLISDVRARPALYRRHVGEIRRHFSTVFPYGVLYHDRSDHVWILAVIPMRRAPDYWMHRL